MSVILFETGLSGLSDITSDVCVYTLLLFIY
jgi:hypothetical protein